MAKKFIHGCGRHQRDHKAGIVRTQMNFCKTAGVPDGDYIALMSGFQRMIDESGRQIVIKDFGNYDLGDGPYESPDWYQDKAMTSKDKGHGQQTSAYTIDSLLRNEPFQKTDPHFDVMIVDSDLTTTEDDTQNNFIFGYGPYPNNILSIRRFRDTIKDDSLRRDCLQIIGAHEFGHNIDLVGRNYNIGTEGYKAGHCNGESGPCLMEQVNVPGARDIEEQAKLLVKKFDLLCPDCTEEVAYKRENLRKRGWEW